MLNLAPIKYADILSRGEGPLDRLEYSNCHLLGLPCVHAVAYLRGDLVPLEVRAKTKAEQPDGAGSHESMQVACHMAISETLERWAVYHLRSGEDKDSCGMGYDESSNGFAAFPGLFARQARKSAFQESIERHCLICWWEGLLSHRCLPDVREGVKAIQIENPFSKHVVTIVWTTLSLGYAFAFGASTNLGKASWRSLIELERTMSLLENLKQAKDQDSQGDLFERRIEYFSTEEGASGFFERLERKSHTQAKPLRFLFDGKVDGPWNRYTTVWRTVLEAPNQDYLSDAADYFFW